MKRKKSIKTYFVKHTPYSFGKKTHYSITTIEAGNREEAEAIFHDMSEEHTEVEIYGIKTKDALAWK